MSLQTTNFQKECCMSKVDYNIKLFDIIKDLTSISNQVVFEKDGDNVIVRRADAEASIAYQLGASASCFDIKDSVAFYNYSDFYSYLKAIDSPDLSFKNDILTIKSTGAKIEYILSDPESIKAGPKSINFKDADIKFVLSSDDLDQFAKMISLIEPKKAKITSDGKKVSIKIFSNLQLHDNTFEKTFDVVEPVELDEEIDFVIFSSTFSNIPLKRNYEIEIKKDGFLKISLVNEDLSLGIFTGKIRD